MTRQLSRLFFALLLGLATRLTLWAQPVAFETVNLPPGSNANEIADIRQDRQGYLWVATAAGLLRYDGYNWITYQHDPKNANSLDQPITGGLPHP